MFLFAIGSFAGLSLVAGAAGFRLGRRFATFIGIILGIHTFTSVALFPRELALAIPYAYLQATVYLHFLGWLYPRKRPLPVRLLVSIPASYFAASAMFAFPWAIVAAFGVDSPPLWWLPFAVGALGVLESSFALEEERVMTLDRAAAPELSRLPRPRRGKKPEGSFSFVQITDPHLGPFMSVQRLKRICQRAVERGPDVILLTGDLCTIETREDEAGLVEALSPLRAMKGRVFACHGNHDHESPAMIRRALGACDVVLLEDEDAVIDTPAGPVQIVGADYYFRARKERLAALAEKCPRIAGAFRLWLVHDPGAFVHVPDGEADLVLSGHTHGGHVGFVRLGIPWTVVRGVGIPDQGLFALGTNRMYVHRGTGHYGFPLRVGVPAEQSLIHVVQA